MPESKLNKPPIKHGLARMQTVAGWISIAILLSWAASIPASEDADRVRTLTLQGRILPLEQLVAMARARKPGTLIEAELDWEPEHGVAVYELLMLGSDGELWELELDARTGELLEVEREHD